MVSRILLSTARRRGLLLGLAATTLTIAAGEGSARAQIAGTTQRPLPNVLLLVDSSGSMERMTDNSMPSSSPLSKCVPGAQTQPNRWGMLIQALTGNLQPYFSCDEISRSSAAFKNEFRIGGGTVNLPYDTDYFLPYHRPLTGANGPDACAFAPSTLPGASPGSGLGPGGLGVNTGMYSDAASFPPEAFVPYKEAYLRSQYGSGALGAPLTPSTLNSCTFEQASDGQLDAARDYVRFGLMMFDNDPSAATGVTGSTPVGGSVISGNPFLGQWSYTPSGANPNLSILGKGRPNGCGVTSDFEVGARHWAAPPWEGRMVRFPNPDGTLYDIQRTNDQIQQVLIGTRPYGATPIDGMIEDARDYLWYNSFGPLGTEAGFRDDYARAGCRDQYIILLTDGAPNLDLRPSCEPGTMPLSQCPYPSKAAQVADQLATASNPNQRVKTFVIGFSVNGAGNTSFVNDGFPTTLASPNNNCKYWYNQVTSNGSNPTAMHNLCSNTPGPAPAKGSTADACCQLSEIAYYGSGATHDTPPFFAESQADLVLSFGRVLGGITKAATTRTLPAYSPAVNISGNGVTGDFIASFIPNAQKVWSGEIDRTRSICVGATPTTQTETVAAGDSFAANTAAQAGSRKFVSVQPANPENDAARTLRPFVTSSADGIVPSTAAAAQVTQASDMALASSSAWADAMSIDDKTCKRSRDVSGTEIPALTKTDCAKVVWGFATASPSNPTLGGYSKWNVRCAGGGSATNGKCSVSGSACALLGASCPVPGEVCVPACSALGAIYRSTPQVIGPPTDLLRDDQYRAFADLRKTRRPAMFVATTDGVLHAFKALSSSWGGGVPAFDNLPSQHELWSFIPPAVLPKLASNYPTGQQILLDGTPAIKDIVWDRKLRTEDPLFHTTLVSGMGAGGGGYYALNISDYDCQGASSTGIGANPRACLDAQITSGLSNISDVAKKTTQGPQFLWQLTDVEAVTGSEVAKVTRKVGSTNYVALFGKESGNAAITTVVADPDGAGARQIGVAILPGGIDGPPVQGENCPRAINGGGFTPSIYDQSDTVTPLAPRPLVRKWAAGPCNSAPVPGRNVTVVRADTGEILRVFGRSGQDIPRRLSAVTTAAPFDSPVIGTPAVYPSGVGVVAQKAFVGDADGTVWRLDMTDPNPANWRVTLFQDLFSPNLPFAPTWAESQPIQIPLTLTQDPFGGIMIAAATGDQESIVASTTERNMLMAIQEQRALGPTTPGRAVVRWYQPFTNAARVTGPMTVFDRTLYFATYQPLVPSAASCNNGGNPLLWGVDYFNANGGNGVDGKALSGGTGGAPRWCPIGSVDSVSGGCSSPFVAFENPTGAYPDLAGAIIPGVTIRAAQSCAQFGAPSSDPALTGMSTTTFSLFFGATAKGSSTSTGSPQAARPTTPLTRPLPRTAANIDSWAFVVD
ncbi:MAG: Type fimbrial biosis protein PilY1 [Labilithrix sp.]|nr:Type fimbrial biosis protein PilY1 [Labilithrix sp.]